MPVSGNLNWRCAEPTAVGPDTWLATEYCNPASLIPVREWVQFLYRRRRYEITCVSSRRGDCVVDTWDVYGSVASNDAVGIKFSDDEYRDGVPAIEIVSRARKALASERRSWRAFCDSQTRRRR